MERVKTGIGGLDEMLNGGLIAGRPYVVMGAPGAGKSVLSTQFLFEGIKNNEKVLYVSLEEAKEELLQNMAVFGWDMSQMKILDTAQELGSERWVLRADTLMNPPEFTLDNLIKTMWDRIKVLKPKRIVVDSVTSVKMLYDKDFQMRRGLLSLMNFLFKSEATSLLTSTESSMNLMEQSLASGIIKLHKIESRGEIIHALSIEKMRGSDFDKHIRPIKITDRGITVFPNETVFEKG